MDRGFDPADARRRALAHFGSRPATADACRDERGTGGIDSLVRDLIYAWRAFRRTPLAVLTIVVTIAIGLAMTTTAFSVFNAIFLRVDDVNRPGELFAVRRVVNSRAWKPFTLGEYEAFRRDTAVFAGTAALSGGIDLRVDGRLARARLVTGDFFPGAWRRCHARSGVDAFGQSSRSGLGSVGLQHEHRSHCDRMRGSRKRARIPRRTCRSERDAAQRLTAKSQGLTSVQLPTHPAEWCRAGLSAGQSFGVGS